MRIEELWRALRAEPVAAQRRVDAEHPLDLYADFVPPDHPGLVLLCPTRPPEFHALAALRIERRQRSDGRWALRIWLGEPKLLPVFAELCRDIVAFTRTGTDPTRAASVVLARIERWRTLLSDRGGLGRSALRGLIGELLVLERCLFPQLGLDAAVSAWTGPLGTDQDFRLPCGRRIEVKAVERSATEITVHGLGQLDPGGDSLRLAVVRLEETGPEAPDALTAAALIAGIRTRLADAPAARAAFDGLLRFVGWEDTLDSSGVTVRLVRIDEYEVDDTFPRLVAAGVPSGVVEATYQISLPRS